MILDPYPHLDQRQNLITSRGSSLVQADQVWSTSSTTFMRYLVDKCTDTHRMSTVPAVAHTEAKPVRVSTDVRDWGQHVDVEMLLSSKWWSLLSSILSDTRLYLIVHLNYNASVAETLTFSLLYMVGVAILPLHTLNHTRMLALGLLTTHYNKPVALLWQDMYAVLHSNSIGTVGPVVKGFKQIVHQVT